MEVAGINNEHCVRAAAAINMLQPTCAKSEACGHQGRLEEAAFQSPFRQTTYIVVQLIRHCPAHGAFISLVGFWGFFRLFVTMRQWQWRLFLLLHKTGLQSKITSARNDVSLPPCNALPAWQAKTILIVSQVHTAVMECRFHAELWVIALLWKKAHVTRQFQGDHSSAGREEHTPF